MALLAQISDTHILPPGELLYGRIDSARHLAETVETIMRMRPRPDAVIVTGDVAGRGVHEAYRQFVELVEPLEMPLYVIPGNHDDPGVMLESLADTPYFPASEDTFQYVVNELPFQILALNSYCEGTELPDFSGHKLTWLERQLSQSGKPALVAIHHPPMVTGIELIDMGGTGWFQALKSLLDTNRRVKLVICGHCHTDLAGRIRQVPVYMAGATSHQLVAVRGLDVAPATIIAPAPPTLHHLIAGEFVSGGSPWPVDADMRRIDREAGLSWEQMKRSMKGNRA